MIGRVAHWRQGPNGPVWVKGSAKPRATRKKLGAFRKKQPLCPVCAEVLPPGVQLCQSHLE